MMLNSDMCLIKDITFNDGGTGGQPTCTHDSCADSPTVSTAEEFAGDNGQFLTEYVSSCIGFQRCHELYPFTCYCMVC